MEWLDQFTAFAQDKWYYMIGALVVIMIIINVVKTMVKWAIIAVIVLGLAIYGVNYTDVIKDVSGQVLDYAQQEAYDAMEKEAESAQYEQNADGSFVVRSNNFTVEGTLDSDDVRITFKGQTFTVSKSEFIRKFLEQVRGNSGK